MCIIEKCVPFYYLTFVSPSWFLLARSVKSNLTTSMIRISLIFQETVLFLKCANSLINSGKKTFLLIFVNCKSTFAVYITWAFFYTYMFQQFSNKLMFCFSKGHHATKNDPTQNNSFFASKLFQLMRQVCLRSSWDISNHPLIVISFSDL